MMLQRVGKLPEPFEFGSGKDAADWPTDKALPEPLPVVGVEEFARKYAHQNKQDDDEVVLTPVVDIKPREIKWLWEGYVPLGKLTLMEGDPGTGKTWVCLAIAAMVSSQGHNVIYASCEDEADDTLRPRLEAMEGVDLSRIYILEGKRAGGVLQHITLKDFRLLEEAISRLRARLLVLDPLQAYVGSDIDFHRANEVRARLAGLKEIAAKHECAIIMVRHLNKSSHTKAMYRGLGTIDLSAIVRSVILCGIDADGNRAIVPIKHNLSQSPPQAQGFELYQGKFYWKGNVNVKAEDLLRVADEGEKTAVEEAEEFLQAVLADGPVPADEVIKQARKFCISQVTLRRAKKMLQVQSYRQGGKKGKWYWSLKDDQTFKDDQPPYKYLDDHLKNAEKHQQNQSLMQDFKDDHMIIFKNHEKDKNNKDLGTNLKMIIKNIKDDHLKDDHLDEHPKNAKFVPELCRRCARLDEAEGVYFCSGSTGAGNGGRPLPAFAFTGAERIEQCEYFINEGGKNAN